MIAGLLLATALATPLDDAAAQGRPIVVLLDSGEWRNSVQPAVWRAHAGGKTHNLFSGVALVFATPAEVEAWTGADVRAYDLMVRIDPADRRLAAHAGIVDVVPPPRLPPPPPNPYDTKAMLALDPDMETALALCEELWRTYNAAAQVLYDEAIADVVATWGRAFVGLLKGAKWTAQPPRTLQVIGAARCTSSGCGSTCDVTDPNWGTADADLGALMCGMGHVTPLTADFLLRWPPETP